MFKIRDDQEHALADEDFVQRVMNYLQARLPLQVARLTASELRAVVRHGIEVARSYDLRSERDLFTFTLDMLAVNPNFHLQREIQGVLNDANIPVDERMPRATDLPEESWREAGTMTDPAEYWGELLARSSPGGGTDERA